MILVSTHSPEILSTFFLRPDAERGEAAGGFMIGGKQIEQNVTTRPVFIESETL
jgi:hypothetical protein